jgi:DNA-binding transcriptional LysR family regulator
MSVPPPDPVRPLVARLKMRQLALVAALDTHRSLRQAAEAVAVTQPAATRLLRELEQSLGVELFVRHAWGMEPTRYGEAFVRYARSMVNEVGEAQRELHDLAAGSRGSLRIGCVTGAVPEWLVPAAREVRATRAGLRLFLLVNTSDVLVDALLAGALDVAIGRLPAGADTTQIDSVGLGVEPLCVVARRGHPLARRSRLHARDFDRMPWILQPPGSPMRQEANLLLERLGVRVPADLIETASIVATLALLRETDALSVVPAGLAMHYGAPGWIERLDVGATDPGSRYDVLVRRGRPLAPAAVAFIATLRSHAATRAVALPQRRAKRSAEARRR